ncbi:MAG: plastocyanin/azurin family copper-binding protein [bacterium]
MKLIKLFSVVAALLLIGLFLGCKGDSSTGPEESPWVKASDWVANANWDAKTTIVVTMHEESANDFHFEPSEITLEAGKPYVLKFTNPAGNSSKHYFATEGAKDFLQAIATRKVQTPDAEYKAPYFKAVELLIGGEVELYFIPVLAGTYDFLCTITGHKEAGMTGKITVTGGEGYELDLEVDTNFDMGLTTDARTSGSNPVWSTAQEVTVQMIENADGSLAFDPETLTLTKDTGYKINLVNDGSNESKHYYTCTDFYKSVVTRKAEDSYAEIKVPYFNAIELLIGGNTELFLVPTKTGEFEVICTIAGHQEAGMHGHIVVQ